ncbi:trimethyltridecatetraene synthase-like [Salvia divinorum]|uniref:Trimethyltridecatetraene synthase-like n=1 Tax=Salvia divinorum TaxID=28513 RepID=A0ABD1H696_SALDI
MENYIIAISLLLILTLITLHILKKIFPQKKLNPPPGPKPWLVIGNLNLIGPLPHRSIHQLSQKYGPVMLLKFGSFPVVVGSSVDAAKIFLKTMDLTFASRPKTSAGKYLTYNYSDIVWSPYGPYWRQARKIFLMELFSARRLESYEYSGQRNGLACEGDFRAFGPTVFAEGQFVDGELERDKQNGFGAAVFGRRRRRGGGVQEDVG